METNMRLKIKTNLTVFGNGLLQDALTLSIVMNANGITFQDIKDYLDLQRQEILIREKIFRKECPECGGTMQLAPVNTTKGDQTGEGSKSVWTCESCLHQVYNRYSIQERFNKKKGGL